jgi:hypothetical protein
MSSKALRGLMNDVLSGVSPNKLGKVLEKDKVLASTFRGNLNKTVHVLIINDYFINTLAPRAVDQLKSSPYYKDNQTTIQTILSAYRASRRSQSGRVPKRTTSYGEGYVLTFPSFASVRRFLDSLGLSGRPTELYNYIKSNPLLQAKLEKLFQNREFLSSPSTLLEALGTLRPEQNKSPSDPFYNNTLAQEVYREVYDLDLGFDVGHNIPVAYKQVQVLANSPQLLRKLVFEFTKKLGLSRKLTTQGIDAILEGVKQKAIEEAKLVSLNNNFVVEKTELDKATGKASVTVFIESAKANQGSESENRILDAFRQLVIGEIRSAFKDSKNISTVRLLNQEGSKTIKQQLIDSLVSEISQKPIINRGTSRAKVAKSFNVNTAKASTKTSNGSTSVKIPQLRSLKGRFVGLTSLENILRELINETVANNMRRPHLEYQTGRFSDSVEVVKLQRTRQDELTAFLTYMKYPYQTFEPGFKQGHKGYDPRILIDRSVREILLPLVKARIRTQVI